MKYFLTSNIIEDTLVCYGMCSILFDNGINYELIRNKSHYLIRYDENDIDDDGIGFEEITEEEIKNLDGTNNLTSKKKRIASANQFFKDNIDSILDNFKNIKYGKETVRVTSIGNNFNGTVLSLEGKLQQQKQISLIYWLSFLGHIKYVGYYYILKPDGKNGKTKITEEFNIILIPKLHCKITNIIASINTIIDKEGYLKVSRCYNTSIAKGVNLVHIEAMAYLDCMERIYKEKYNYEKNIIMKNLVVSQNNAKDITKHVDISNNYSLDIIQLFKQIINPYNKTDDNIKNITSVFVLENSYYNFEKLIEIYAKGKQYLDICYGKELISMFKNKVQEVYNNESVQKIGKRLGELLRQKKGYEILTQFLGTSNEMQLSNTISNLLAEYNRYTKGFNTNGWSAITDEELLDIINLVDNKKDAIVTSRAIIAYAKVFFANKENVENNENEEI